MIGKHTSFIDCLYQTTCQSSGFLSTTFGNYVVNVGVFSSESPIGNLFVVLQGGPRADRYKWRDMGPL